MEASPEEEGGGRWERARRSRAGRPWLGVFLVIVVLPILIGGAVLLIAGRGVAFEVVRRLTARKFPDVQWIERAELARWREDSSRPQPLVLDARTAPEYQVSHLKDAVLMDPDGPLCGPSPGGPRTIPIVVYSSVGYRGARLSSLAFGPGLLQRAGPLRQPLPVGQRRPPGVQGRATHDRDPPV